MNTNSVGLIGVGLLAACEPIVRQRDSSPRVRLQRKTARVLEAERRHCL